MSFSHLLATLLPGDDRPRLAAMWRGRRTATSPRSRPARPA
ncbi:hypothetical protein ACFYU9_02840 [Streptomyces sp. NPDC004327]